MVNVKSIKENWVGFGLAVIVGITAITIKEYGKFFVFDPLLIALLIGILLRSFINFPEKFVAGFKLAPMILIPIGVIMYGAVNLNFNKFSEVDPMVIFIIFFAFLGNATFIFFLSTFFNIKPNITYLITVGSAICGASAITIASDAIEAEPDEVSHSLISIFITALIALFIVLPIAGVFFKMSGIDYSIMSGAIMQLTGFVKEAVIDMPASIGASDTNLMSLAVSVKAIRYVGLLIMIPLFASFAKGRFHVPWYLWGFLLAGIIFSFLPKIDANFNLPLEKIKTVLDPSLTYFWSIAMGAIGLNASVKPLFSKIGFKVFAITFVSFVFALAVFLGLYLPLREIIF